MKFQFITLIAALSLIAPVLATPAPAPNYDNKPAKCELSNFNSYHIDHSTNEYTYSEQVIPTYVFLSTGLVFILLLLIKPHSTHGL